MDAEKIIKSIYGSVRPYTRHSDGCPNSPENHSCRCAKWIYIFDAATKKKTRRSLNTPSWAEAVRLAHETLRGLDPEIATARKLTQKKECKLCTVAEACDLWIERSVRKSGEDGSTTASYRTLKWFVTRWTEREGITHVQDITSLHLQKWQKTTDWTSLAKTTRQQRWGVVRSLFSYLVVMGVLDKSPAAPIAAEHTRKGNVTHVQGPYTDSQVEAILGSVEASIPFNLTYSQRPTYASRVRLFIRMLDGIGCDVSDAIQFQPMNLDTVKVGKKRVHVYRYRRQKTGVLAVVPITDDLAKELKEMPIEPGAVPSMPFRMPGLKLKLDAKKWSNRVKSAIDKAGVTHVELPDGTRKPANVKQFRHTAAVRWLKEGQRPEEVARMLGHVDTEMVRKHYAPWVPELDDAHIRRVVGRWK